MFKTAVYLLLIGLVILLGTVDVCAALVGGLVVLGIIVLFGLKPEYKGAYYEVAGKDIKPAKLDRRW